VSFVDRIMDTLVSIYLPTRNRRALLQRAALSVLCQTHLQLELIVVDDGSADNTAGYLAELARSDARVTVLTNRKPMGPSHCRNMAIRLARGAFVTGLDDDDEFTPDRIERFVTCWREFSRRSTAPFCLFSQSVFVSDGRRAITRDRKDHVKFADLFQHNYIGNQIFCAKDDLIQAGLFDDDLRAWEDLDLFMRVLMRVPEARLVDAATYICDVSANRDRISRNEPRIRQAFEQISAKYPKMPPAAHQGLFLQMFSDYHGIRPSLSDYRRFLSWGFRVDGLMRMVRASARGLQAVAQP
jgi:glycosyltransferase involved in cell wall biosynthesis